MRVHEVIIVGAGPIGIEFAVSLTRAGIDYAHIEAGSIGHTLTWWAPQTRFFSSPERISIAGVPLVGVAQEKATREEYLAYLRAVVEQFDLQIAQHERVTGIRHEGEGGERVFTLTTERHHATRTWRARRVVLAMGDMHRPRLLGIPGEGLPHVSHYFDDPHRLFRQRVVIVGGKNSAVEAAIRSYRVGAHVTLAYRGTEISERVKYWLRPELLALFKAGHIDFLPGVAPIEITPDVVRFGAASGAVPEGLRRGGGDIEVAGDFVLLMTGYEQDTTLFEIAGVALEGEGRKPRHNPRTMETNVAGLFVAGTAAAGTQVGGVKVFIETAHVHVRRIMAAITGSAAQGEDLDTPEYVLPES
jgi:thioredoxin reductase (NADPH)